MRKHVIVALVAAVAAGCYESNTRFAGDGRTGDAAADDAADAVADAGRDDGAADGAADPGTDGGGDTVVPPDRGECRTSADCGGRACVRLPDMPGGYRVCADPPATEAKGCTNPSFDDCCWSSECTEGVRGGCYYSEGHVCGGPMPMPQNYCFYDECGHDNPCETGPGGVPMVCVEAGVLGLLRNACLPYYCALASSCGGRPGAYCRPVMNPCCPSVASGFFCADPAACEDDEDCRNSSCTPGWDNGWLRCELVACPA